MSTATSASGREREEALWKLLLERGDINSGSANPAGLERMGSALVAEFGKIKGASVEAVSLAGTPSKAVRVRMRPNSPIQILLSGHYDTVYGPEHPFQRCERIGEVLRGPGVTDMKGGIVVLLEALRLFEEDKDSDRIGWEVLLTPDEEIGSEASSPLFIEAAGRHRLALVFEPTRPNGDLVRARKGIGAFVATCHGRAAHAGRDLPAGRNAILALAEFLQKADELNREIPGVLVNVGTIRGGSALNVVPDFAQAEINARVDRRSDEATVIDRLRALAAPINAREGFRLEVAGTFSRPPKEVTPVDERLFAAWQACGKELGHAFFWQDTGGGSDGSNLADAGLPCLDGLGVVGDRVHSPEEWVRLPSIRARAQIAALFLVRAARGQIELPAQSESGAPPPRRVG